jgi:hypothetical protein
VPREQGRQEGAGQQRGLIRGTLRTGCLLERGTEHSVRPQTQGLGPAQVGVSPTPQASRHEVLRSCQPPSLSLHQPRKRPGWPGPTNSMCPLSFCQSLHPCGTGLRCFPSPWGGGGLIDASRLRGDFRPLWNDSQKPTRVLHAAAVALAPTSLSFAVSCTFFGHRIPPCQALSLAFASTSLMKELTPCAPPEALPPSAIPPYPSGSRSHIPSGSTWQKGPALPSWPHVPFLPLPSHKCQETGSKGKAGTCSPSS